MVFRKLLCFLFIFTTLFFEGCASSSIREVYIPIKCDVPPRIRPQDTPNLVAKVVNLLVYTEGLENDLNYCRGVK